MDLLLPRLSPEGSGKCFRGPEHGSSTRVGPRMNGTQGYEDTIGTHMTEKAAMIETRGKGGTAPEPTDPVAGSGRRTADLTPLVVTFVGLPGTGKSRLVSHVTEVLRQRGVPCDSSDEVAFRKLRNKLVWALQEICL